MGVGGELYLMIDVVMIMMIMVMMKVMTVRAWIIINATPVLGYLLAGFLHIYTTHILMYTYCILREITTGVLCGVWVMR